eukprot:6260557-Amphidinium_carterae.2
MGLILCKVAAEALQQRIAKLDSVLNLDKPPLDEGGFQSMHMNKCKIIKLEDWRWRGSPGGPLRVQGEPVTVCAINDFMDESDTFAWAGVGFGQLELPPQR